MDSANSNTKLSKITPKATSFHYGKDYQLEQVEKHRDRRNNHWAQRIAIIHQLIDEYVLPRINPTSIDKQLTALDVGCSVGTMAIEMAARGFVSHGVDFDAAALELARQLADEEQVHVTFYNNDVSDLSSVADTEYDIILCSDIFEHLHDDELGSLLNSLKSCLKAGGYLVFYTFPTQYDFLFYSRDFISWPLWPFKWLKISHFDRIARAYASIIDAMLLLTSGVTYKEKIKRHSHCNPTTPDRLMDILQRAGYDVDIMKTDNIYPFKKKISSRFSGQRIAHRNMYGIAHLLRSEKSES